MKKQSGPFWIGLLVYAISFLLTAVAGSAVTSDPARGYHCAFWAFVGWINPIFLVTIALMLTGRPNRSIAILRFIIVLMIPFCWIVFYYEALYPREGWLVWIAGILLVLFSRRPIESSGVPAMA